MIRIAVSGAAGRMGRAIITSIDQNPATELSGALEREDSPFIGKDTGELTGLGKNGVRITDSLEKALKKADVVIDFSTPEASMKLIETAVAFRTTRGTR